MITTEFGYKQTLELLEREKAGLKRIRKEFPTLSERKLKLLESGSKLLIKQMEEEIREYERTRLKKAS
jgi:hypothetical protein